MRVLAFVSALLCVGCISTQALTSLGDIDIDITREFNYKDQEEADANPLPKEIEENGNTYVLDEDSVDAVLSGSLRIVAKKKIAKAAKKPNNTNGAVSNRKCPS